MRKHQFTIARLLINMAAVAAVAAFAAAYPEVAVRYNVFSPSLLFGVIALYLARDQARFLVVLGGFVTTAIFLTSMVTDQQLFTNHPPFGLVLQGLSTFSATVAATIVDRLIQRASASGWNCRSVWESRTPSCFLTAAVIVIGTAMLCLQSEGIVGMLFLVPLAFGPLFFSLVQALYWRHNSSQIVLGLGSIAYAIWFAAVYHAVAFGPPDTNSVFAFFFVGICALPVMLCVWLLAAICNRIGTRARVRREADTGAGL